MDDDWFGPFMFSTTLLLVAVFWLAMALFAWTADADKWRKECVLRGVAEWVRTEGGDIEWRWKE